MKKLILLGALVCAGYAHISNAAIARDASSSGSCWQNCTNNINWSHAVSGTNRGLLVFLTGYDANDTCDYHVMYNNIEMTQVAASAKYDGSQFKTFVFKQENPSTSATGVSAVSRGGCGFSAAAVSYTGVNQTNMIDTYATGTNPAGVVASVTTTTGVANAYVVSGHGQDSLSGWWVLGSGQTERVHVNDGVYGRGLEVTDRKVTSSGSTVQMTAQPNSFSKGTGSVAVSLVPADGETIWFSNSSSGSCWQNCTNNTNWNHDVSGLTKATGSVLVSLAPAP